MTILWDWNGTLVADVPLVVKVNNAVFAAHGYRDTTEEEYRRLFRFPVRDYYHDLGVTDEDFDSIAKEWNEGFMAGFSSCGLQPYAAETVRRFRDAGFRQVIISASRQDLLHRQVGHFPELNGMFDDMLGLPDVYAVSKVQLARDYLSRNHLAPDDLVFLGDTCHDAEVARDIGCPCFLISGGHQCDAVLLTASVPVLPSLKAAADRLVERVR